MTHVLDPVITATITVKIAYTRLSCFQDMIKLIGTTNNVMARMCYINWKACTHYSSSGTENMYKVPGLGRFMVGYETGYVGGKWSISNLHPPLLN
jgi:hypothetical protein